MMRRSSMLGLLLRRPVAVASAGWLAAVLVATLAPDLLAVADPLEQDLPAALQGPSGRHPLGTDLLGRDLLSRLVHGTAESMAGAAAAMVVAVFVGVTLGLIAGFYRRWVDAAVARLADVLFALPNVVILLVILAVLPGRMTLAMAVFGVIIAPGLIRVVRSATLALRNEPFVAAATVSGLSSPQILRRHIAPRLAGLIIVQASLAGALATVLQSGLGFLGFGPPPPAPSWGGMLTDAVAVIGRHPWSLAPPGAAIGLTAVALVLFGDAMRDASTERWTTRAEAPARRSGKASVLAGPPGVVAQGEAPQAPARPALLALRRLTVTIPTASGPTVVVDDVTLDIAEGEIVGLLGESGCGKTVTALSIIGLVPGNGAITGGACFFRGTDLVRASRAELAAVRGRGIGFVSQEASAALDPTFRIGSQLAEAIRRHTGASRAAARKRAVELLGQVRLPDPEAVARRYPYQVSGGMAQRVSIAFGLAGDPKLLIADEPTSALDVTVQAEILDLIRNLSRERRMAVLLVTHDWGVVADVCDRIAVMYAGEVVEQSQVAEIFWRPLHPYTEGLLQANPEFATRGRRLPTIPGSVPHPGSWPAGCRFAPRCPHAGPPCAAPRIPMVEPIAGRMARCVLAVDRAEGVVQA